MIVEDAEDDDGHEPAYAGTAYPDMEEMMSNGNPMDTGSGESASPPPAASVSGCAPSGPVPALSPSSGPGPTGPSSPAGKAAASRNSIKHSASSRKHIRDAFGRKSECEEALIELAAGGLARALLGNELALSVPQSLATAADRIGEKTGSDLDARLATIAQAPGLSNISRYARAGLGDYRRAIALLGELQLAPVSAAPEAPDVVSPPEIQTLRELLAEVTDELLLGLHATGADVELPDDVDSRKAMLEEVLKETFLAETGLDRDQAIVIAACEIVDPEMSIADISRNCGVNRRHTIKKCRRKVRELADAGRDWLLLGLKGLLRVS